MNKKTCVVLEKLLNEGWFETKEEIIPWIITRKIIVDNKPICSISEKVPLNAKIQIKEYYKKKYVGKGGLKLEHAIKEFNVIVKDKVALDCGASTGGFTDCLCYFGAKKVYAVDVGYGQLAAKLQHLDNVVNMEKTNLSNPVLLSLDPKPELITLDLSYLSLNVGLKLANDIIGGKGEIIALIKPIFEVQSTNVRRNGNINSYDLHYQIIHQIVEKAISLGFNTVNLTYSPIRGNGGAVEYFIYLTKNESNNYISDNIIDKIIKKGLCLEKFKK